MWRLLAQKALLGWAPRPSHSLTPSVVLEAAQGYFQIGHNGFKFHCLLRPPSISIPIPDLVAHFVSGKGLQMRLYGDPPSVIAAFCALTGF